MDFNEVLVCIVFWELDGEAGEDDVGVLDIGLENRSDC